MNYNLITILGPTATGKTKLAAYLAYHFNGEIISADSRQVYKYMDIGTGKDYDDYICRERKIPYHLIDIVEPTEEYNLFQFHHDFQRAYSDIISRDKFPFLAGGTGLYLSSVIQKYDLHKAQFTEEGISQLKKLSLDSLRNILVDLKPKQHNVTDLEDKGRIIKAIIVAESEAEPLNNDVEIKSLNIGNRFDRDIIKSRITERLRKRLESGMIEEVKKLLDMGVTHEKLRFFGLEYKYLSLYLQGKLSYNDMYQKLNSAIHKFAKRQMTWFRKMEREGVPINWFGGNDYEKIRKFIEMKLGENETPAW